MHVWEVVGQGEWGVRAAAVAGGGAVNVLHVFVVVVLSRPLVGAKLSTGNFAATSTINSRTCDKGSTSRCEEASEAYDTHTRRHHSGICRAIIDFVGIRAAETALLPRDCRTAIWNYIIIDAMPSRAWPP